MSNDEPYKYKKWEKFENKLDDVIKKKHTELSVEVNARSNSDFFDLFVIGKLISALDHYKPRIHWSFNTADIERLEALRLRTILESNGTVTEIEKKSSGYWNAKPNKKQYWIPLFPLMKIKIDNRPQKKDEPVDKVNQLSKNVFSACSASLEANFSGEYLWAVKAEIHRIVNIALREIISNSFEHSLGRHIYIAIVAKRDTSHFRLSRSTFSHDTAFKSSGTIDAIELLVADNGRGLLDGIMSTLKENDITRSASDAVWSSFSKEALNSDAIRRLEETFLTQLMNGELALRRGRRSEGLKQVFKELSWAEGVVNMRTGASSCEYHPVSTIAHPIPSSKFHIPGLIYSSYHLSYSLRLTNRKYLSDQAELDLSVDENLFYSNNKPKAFFGGSSFLKILRRAEIDVHEVATNIKDELNSQKSDFSICVIDLENSPYIELEYLDSFLQEAARCTLPGKDFLLSQCIVLRGLRRELIFKLRFMTSQAVLIAIGTFVLCLDEYDIPHFLGIPRFGQSIFDIEDILVNAYLGYNVPIKNFLSSDNGNNEYHQYLKNLAKSKSNCLLKLTSNSKPASAPVKNKKSAQVKNKKEELDSTPIFAQVKHKIEELDHEQTSAELKRFLLPRPLQLIDQSIQYGFDFRHLYSKDRCLITAYRSVRKSVVENGITSIWYLSNNGNRLALEIAVQLAIEDAQMLIYREEPSKPGWDVPPARGQTALVLDIIYPSDIREQDSPVGRLLLEVSEKISLLVVSAASESAMTEFEETYPEISIVAALSKHENDPLPKGVDRDKPPLSSSLDYKNAPIAEKPGQIGRRSLYSEIELSTDFWQHAKEIDYLASGDDNRFEDSRKLVIRERNRFLMSNLRVRQQIRSLLRQFVVEKLSQNVKVIVHPTHAIGAWLAREVASMLPCNPLILALRQPVYGGQIKISTEDMSELTERVSELKSASNLPLRTLILDDSVVSGSSLTKMFGIAHLLNLEVTGIFVVLNRLDSSVSEAVEKRSGAFAYLFRLHVGQETTHYKELDDMRDRLESVSKSTISQRVADTCRSISDTIKYALRPQTGDWNKQDRKKFSEDIKTLRSKIRKRYADSSAQHYQIFFGLILNESLDILDLQSRLIVIQNFIDAILESDFYWDVLRETISLNPGKMLERLMASSTLLIASNAMPASSDVPDRFWAHILHIVENNITDFKSNLNQAIILINANHNRKWFCNKLKGLLDKSITWNDDQVLLFAVILHYLTLDNKKSILGDEDIFNLLERCRSNLNESSANFTEALALSNRLAQLSSRQILLKFNYIPYDAADSSHRIAELSENPKSPEIQFLSDAPGTRYCLSILLNTSGAEDLFLFESSSSDEATVYAFRARESKNMKRKPLPMKRIDLEDILGSDGIESVKQGRFFYIPDLRNESKKRKSIVALAGTENSDYNWLYGFPYINHSSGSSHCFVLVLVFREKFDPARAFESFLAVNYLTQKVVGNSLSRVLGGRSSIVEEWQTFRSGLYLAHDPKRKGQRTKRVRLRREASSRGTTELLYSLTEVFEQPIEDLTSINQFLREYIENFYKTLNRFGNSSGEPEAQATLKKLDIPENSDKNSVKFTCASVAVRPILFELARNAFCYGTDEFTGSSSILKPEDLEDFDDDLDKTRDYLCVELKNTIGSGLENLKERGLDYCKQFLERHGGFLCNGPNEERTEYKCVLLLPVHIVPKQLVNLVKLG